MIRKLIRPSHTIYSCIRYSFCKQLPNSTRFSQQLGLSKQFKTLQVKAIQSQNSYVKIYQIVLIGLVSVMGFYIMTIILKPQQRSKVNLYMLMYKHKYGHSMQAQTKTKLQKQFITSLQQHHQKYLYLDDNYSFNTILNYCVQEILSHNCSVEDSGIIEGILSQRLKEKVPKYRQMLKIVQRYIQIVLMAGTPNIPSNDTLTIVQYSILYGSPHLVYLSFLLLNQNTKLLKQHKLYKQMRESIDKHKQNQQNYINVVQKTTVNKESLLLNELCLNYMNRKIV